MFPNDKWLEGQEYGMESSEIELEIKTDNEFTF